jgi:hypothetical protein
MELSETDYKKLKSISRRIRQCAKEISDMGFDVYLNNGQLSIMDGPTHDDSMSQNPLRENQIFSIDLHGFCWDGGDW